MSPPANLDRETVPCTVNVKRPINRPLFSSLPPPNPLSTSAHDALPRAEIPDRVADVSPRGRVTASSLKRRDARRRDLATTGPREQCVLELRNAQPGETRTVNVRLLTVIEAHSRRTVRSFARVRRRTRFVREQRISGRGIESSGECTLRGSRIQFGSRQFRNVR